MNDETYQKLGFVEVGFDCYYGVISTVLEYYDLLELALGYVFCFFPYNRETITDYEFNKKPSEYLIESEPLGFKNIRFPFLTFRRDHAFYTRSGLDAIDDIKIMHLKCDTECEINDFINRALLYNYPICLRLDINLIRDEYKKHNRNVGCYQTKEWIHYIVLFEHQDGFFEIFDKEARVKGKIDGDIIKRAIDPSNFDAFFIEPKTRNENIDIDGILATNIKVNLRDKITLDKNDYICNENGIQALIYDIESIIEQLQSIVCKYTPQYLVFSFYNYINMLKSSYYLFQYINNRHYGNALFECVRNLKRLIDLWEIFRRFCGKIYLENGDLLMEAPRIRKILNEIKATYRAMTDEMSKIYYMLSKR